MKKVIYIIGSLKNKEIPHIGERIRKLGFDVFDQWWAAGCHFCEHSADESWDLYRKIRGQNYREAVYDYAAQNIFRFDKYHLDRADIGVLVMPAGKAAHLEMGYLRGQNKRVYILFDKEPERVDIMHGFATDIFFNEETLHDTLRLQLAED